MLTHTTLDCSLAASASHVCHARFTLSVPAVTYQPASRATRAWFISHGVRTSSAMRIASFDVESLFDRAKRSTNGHGPRPADPFPRSSGSIVMS